MARDYRRLWNDITSVPDEGKAARTLAEILVDKEGRYFISDLGCGDAELCIEILDHVSHSLHPLPTFAISVVSLGSRRSQTQDHREAGFLHHAEATCWDTRSTARFHGDNKED